MQTTLQVWSSITPEKLDFLKAELAFFDEVTNVSGQLYPIAKDKRKSAAVNLVGKVSNVVYIILSPFLLLFESIAVLFCKKISGTCM